MSFDHLVGQIKLTVRKELDGSHRVTLLRYPSDGPSVNVEHVSSLDQAFHRAEDVIEMLMPDLAAELARLLTGGDK